MKSKAEECKELTDKVPLLFNCELYPINSASLSQGWEDETCIFGYGVGFFLAFLCWTGLLRRSRCISQCLYGGSIVTILDGKEHTFSSRRFSLSEPSCISGPMIS